MAKIAFGKNAKADIQEIIQFYLLLTGQETTERKITALFADLERIARNELLGNADKRLKDQTIKYWYALDTDYKVYFRRRGRNSIGVVRVWSNRRRPLKPDEIK